MIKAVIFDIDGVLADSLDANTRFFQNLMVEAGYKPPTKKEYSSLFHLTMMDVVKELTKSKSEKEIQRVFEMGKILPYPISYLKSPNGSKKVIEQLSKKYKLALVSSRVRKSVNNYFKFSKTEKYFPVSISYEDTLKHKPNPEPLVLAAKRLSINPQEAIYIGDNKSDVLAGKAANMKVIIYSKKRLKEANLCTSDFSSIPALISRLT